MLIGRSRRYILSYALYTAALRRWPATTPTS